MLNWVTIRPRNIMPYKGDKHYSKQKYLHNSSRYIYRLYLHFTIRGKQDTGPEKTSITGVAVHELEQRIYTSITYWGQKVTLVHAHSKQRGWIYFSYLSTRFVSIPLLTSRCIFGKNMSHAVLRNSSVALQF
jgi:hypothetical protein